MYNRQVVYRVIPWNFQSFGSEFATNLRREWAASRPRYNVTFRRPRVRSRVETWRTGEINEMSDLRANGNSNNCVHSRPRVSPDSSLKPVKSSFRILSAITRPIVPFPFSPALSRLPIARLLNALMPTASILAWAVKSTIERRLIGIFQTRNRRETIRKRKCPGRFTPEEAAVTKLESMRGGMAENGLFRRLVIARAWLLTS